MENKERIEYLDAVKAFAILCVIIGHLVSWNGAPAILYDTIYSFHMPLFMTVVLAFPAYYLLNALVDLFGKNRITAFLLLGRERKSE